MFSETDENKSNLDRHAVNVVLVRTFRERSLKG